MKNLSNSSLGAIIITAISLIGTAVTAASGHTVPADWWTLNYVLVGATAGVSVPGSTVPKEPA